MMTSDFQELPTTFPLHFARFLQANLGKLYEARSGVSG